MMTHSNCSLLRLSLSWTWRRLTAAFRFQAPQAKQFVRRAPLQGLGATAAPQSHKEKRFIKAGETRAAPKEMVVYDAEGNIKHTRTANDRLVERIVKGPAVGKTMRVTRGRHSGLLCTVAAIHQQVGLVPELLIWPFFVAFSCGFIAFRDSHPSAGQLP